MTYKTPSIKSQRRLAGSHALETFFSAYASRLGGRLEERLRPLLRDGETMPDVTLLLKLLGRYMADLRRALEGAGKRRADAITAMRLAYRDRDRAEKEARTRFVDLRQVAAGAYRRQDLESLGLAGRIARHPFPLFRQGTDLLARFSHPDFVLPEPIIPGVALSPPVLEEKLRPLVSRLGQRLQGLLAARRRLEAARVRQSNALRALERAYVQLGQVAHALCVLLDEPWLAGRTHRSLRRLDRKLGKDIVHENEAEA